MTMCIVGLLRGDLGHGHRLSLSHFGRLILRKILAPIKIKSAALPPQKKPKIPPPKTRNFMDMVFPAERTHFSRHP